jgi:hypothetical protein
MFESYFSTPPIVVHRECGGETRGPRNLPRSATFEGRFGRLFRSSLHFDFSHANYGYC